jgi:hypothetical protein
MVFVALFTSSLTFSYEKWRIPAILLLYCTVLRRCRRSYRSSTAYFADFDPLIISTQCSMFIINVMNKLVLWGMTLCRIAICAILRRRLTAYIFRVAQTHISWKTLKKQATRFFETVTNTDLQMLIFTTTAIRPAFLVNFKYSCSYVFTVLCKLWCSRKSLLRYHCFGIG